MGYATLMTPYICLTLSLFLTIKDHEISPSCPWLFHLALFTLSAIAQRLSRTQQHTFGLHPFKRSLYPGHKASNQYYIDRDRWNAFGKVLTLKVWKVLTCGKNRPASWMGHRPMIWLPNCTLTRGSITTSPPSPTGLSR